MTPERFRDMVLIPGLEGLFVVTGVRVSKTAARWLLAVALQESRLEHRYQLGSPSYPGPARGWWQFEEGGGVKGVMRHPASSERAASLCTYYGVEWAPTPIWRALEGHDGLATGFARLLLLTDPKPIPSSQDDGWACYLRVWRPGKPHPLTWPENWQTAGEVIA